MLAIYINLKFLCEFPVSLYLPKKNPTGILTKLHAICTWAWGELMSHLPTQEHGIFSSPRPSLISLISRLEVLTHASRACFHGLILKFEQKVGVVSKWASLLCPESQGRAPQSSLPRAKQAAGFSQASPLHCTFPGSLPYWSWTCLALFLRGYDVLVFCRALTRWLTLTDFSQNQ
jgi:hypothetical protein